MDRWKLTEEGWYESLQGDRVWSMQQKSGSQEGTVHVGSWSRHR